MIVSGGLALIWTDTTQGGGWSWPEVYRLMAGLMVVAAAVSAAAAAAPARARATAPHAPTRDATCWALAPCWLAVAWACC
jgi:hypothetical protein